MGTYTNCHVSCFPNNAMPGIALYIKGLTVIDENYLQQKLEWVKYRLDKLDQVEAKLTVMRQLAESARDNILYFLPA